MEPNETIRSERKRRGLEPPSPHQILLVGSNPLPCYVAVLTLRPERVTLLCSKENLELTLTLRGRIVSEGIACDPPIEIPDASSVREVAKAVAKVQGIKGAGLHYTGGKKTMSVHAHRHWLASAFDKADLGLTQASYLDAQTVRLVFDQTDIAVDLKRKPYGHKIQLDLAISAFPVSERTSWTGKVDSLTRSRKPGSMRSIVVSNS